MKYMCPWKNKTKEIILIIFQKRGRGFYMYKLVISETMAGKMKYFAELHLSPFPTLANLNIIDICIIMTFMNTEF